MRVVACAGDPSGVPVVSATAYAGAARRALLTFKERGRVNLARPLAYATAQAALARVDVLPLRYAPGDGLLVVPVPSSVMSVRRRGYDPVRRLASLVAESLAYAGVPAAWCPALRLATRVSDQAGLSASERQANLAGAHDVARRYATYVAGRAVLVVDDVVTTGSTVGEAARALFGVGAARVGAVTVAATALRVPRGAGALPSALHVAHRCD